MNAGRGSGPGHCFESPVRVGFASADAAGVLFYPEAFRLAHEVYERFLESRGQGLAGLLAAGRIGLPIVHAEADFHAPLTLGADAAGRLAITEVGRSSFRVRCVFVDASGRERVRVESVHVCVHLPQGRPGPLPGELREVLEAARDAGQGGA